MFAMSSKQFLIAWAAVVRIGLQESNDHQQAAMGSYGDHEKLRNAGSPSENLAQFNLCWFLYVVYRWSRKHILGFHELGAKLIYLYDMIWIDDLAIIRTYFCLMVYVDIVTALQFDF